MKNMLTRNEVIGDLNVSTYELNKVIRIVENIYSQNLPNFSNIIKDKIYEFEQLFEKNNKSLYSSPLGQVILNYFYYLHRNINGYVYELADTLTKLPKLLLLRSYFALVFYIFVKRYKNSCSKLNSFPTENDILKTLKIYFKNIEFYYYLPGDIYKIYDAIKQELIDLNLFELTNDMDAQLLSIINNKEKLLNELYEIAKIDYGSDEKAYLYIQEIIETIKDKNKQKKR